MNEARDARETESAQTAAEAAEAAQSAETADPRPGPPLSARLEEQERRLQLTSFDNDDAWHLGCLLVELARSREHGVAIDIRRAGHQLFHCALPGATPDNDSWIERKIRVVERFGHSSLLIGQRHRERGTTFEAATPHLDPARYAAHGGCFPIIIRGVGPIGTVTVSGLPQTQDHALVVEALEKFIEDAASAER